MLIVVGIVLLIAGVLLVRIARPSGAEVRPFLRAPYSQETYALLLTGFIGFGLVCVGSGTLDLLQ